MGRDMVVALGAATVTGGTLLGANEFGPSVSGSSLRYLPAREHAIGEQVTHPRARLSEVRQTGAVLGLQPAGGWGLSLGCNEHGLAAGATAWRSRLAGGNAGLVGPDFVRLVLERGRSASQALELLTELVERHGQSGTDGDSSFLLADAEEAFVVEAAGTHWALSPCHQTRAVCDVGLVRQDWQRLSRGLGEMVFEQRWWPSDGTKLDFHASLVDPSEDDREGLRRWSRATLALAQQEGALDPYCLRRLLAEHFEQCHSLDQLWQGSWIVSLRPGQAPIVWLAPGQLTQPLYFPLVVGAALPQAWVEGLPATGIGARSEEERTSLFDRLQAQFDQDIDAHVAAPGADERHRSAGGEWMNRHVESWLREIRTAQAPAEAIRGPRDVHAFVTE